MNEGNGKQDFDTVSKCNIKNKTEMVALYTQN